MRNFWDLIASLDCLNGLLRTIFKVIMSFPSAASANIRTLSIVSLVSCFHSLTSPFSHSLDGSLFLSKQVLLVRRFCLKNCVLNFFVKESLFNDLKGFLDLLQEQILLLRTLRICCRLRLYFFCGLTYALNFRYIAAVGTNMSDIYLLVEVRVR